MISSATLSLGRVPLFTEYTFSPRTQAAAEPDFVDVLAASLVLCNVVPDKPLSTALRLHAPDSVDVAEVENLTSHSDQLLAASEKAVTLTAGMACELNADPTGRFAIGAVAIFVCCFRAVFG